MSKQDFYSIRPILKYNATYNMIIGKRSNGKTYAVDDYGLKDYCENGWQMALIRRWGDDFKGKRGQQMFEALVANGLVEKYTKGKWNDIYYYSSRWYLCKWDDELKKRIVDDIPFCFAFSINAMEHDKSTSYPKIHTIFFDEFIARSAYIPDEFVSFMNIVSTIVRTRDDVKVFMCGNTINQYCPYFDEMGITNIKRQKKGTIDLYQYGNSDLTVAVEYCSDVNNVTKKADKYFAFDNPKLRMITDGAWEMAMYPHLPMKYERSDVIFQYYIKFNGETLHCEVIDKNGTCFTYIHNKTTPIYKENEQLVYTTEYMAGDNYRRRLTKPKDDIDRKVFWFFANEKVFYANNAIGEVVRNYLEWSSTSRIM